VSGPGQSGKSTLVKHIFPYHEYVNLEQTGDEMFAQYGATKNNQIRQLYHG
jgi:predicted kinase